MRGKGNSEKVILIISNTYSLIISFRYLYGK